MSTSVERPPDPYLIFVNGKDRQWNEKDIDYPQVVKLAFPAHEETMMFTVQYSLGPKANPQGELEKGQRVEVQKDMVFDVSPTDKS